MNKINKIWNKIVLIIYAVFLPMIAFGQVTGEAPADMQGKILNPLGPNTNTIDQLIGIVLEKAIIIGIPIIALAVIYSGFLFVAARGNSERLTKAKDTLLYTLIGAAILLGSWAIAQMIQATVTALKS